MDSTEPDPPTTKNFVTQPDPWMDPTPCPTLVRLSVCRVARLNLRTERHRKPKIGRMEAHQTNKSVYLEVKRSKLPGRLMLTRTMHHMHVWGIFVTQR